MPRPLPSLRRATTVALLALLAGPVFGQAEPALLSPASETPAFAKSGPVDRHVLRQRPVDVRAAPLAEKSDRGGTAFSIELFDGRTVAIDTARVESRAPGNFTYFGRIRGQARSEAVLTFVDGHLAADIVPDPQHGATAYRIVAQPGSGHWLQEIDPAAFPPDHPGGAEALPDVRTDKLVQGAALADGEATELDTGSTIDLMVVYSNQTAAAAGTAIGSQIQAAVDRANLAYANSGVAMRLRLVHAAQVNYSESGSFSTDLSRLSGSTDGYMDNVHTLRNTYGADMVSLFVENASACGIGYIGPSSGAAFTVVARSCASGNLTLAHEIGHNFGARHDTYVDASTSPYAYGHGYVYVAGGWRTVMAYNNACAAVGKSCTRIAHLSNPNVSYGTTPAPTGTTATADVARVHNQNALTVANFRTAVTPGCSYSFSPASASVASAGGSGSTSVTAGSGCAWSATSNASWLSIGSGSGTSGSGTLYYSATANTGPARSGAISVGGVSFSVSQASGCSYTVSPTSLTVAASGGSGSISVSTSSGCAWSASSSASWIVIASGASGSGSGTVTYSAASNTGAQRSANLTIAGRTVTVTQSATSTSTTAATLTPTTMDFGNVFVGRVSNVLGGSFTNTGTTTVTLSSIALGGTHPADFSPRNACYAGQSLAPGASCTIGYAFSPKAGGTRSATATIASNAGTKSIALTGNGKTKGKS